MIKTPGSRPKARQRWRRFCLGTSFIFVFAVRGHAADISGNLSGVLSISGSPYTATANVAVPAGQTLSIDPGVIILMSPNTNFIVNGTLSAVGTPASPILITSLSEGTAQAAPGQWGAIQFNNSTPASQLTNVAIRYGQQVVLNSASPQLDNVTISSMSVRAIQADINSFPSGSGNSAFGSPVNGIDVPGNIDMGQTGTWGVIGIPYIVRSGYIDILNGTTLTINPGVVVKFSDYQTAYSRFYVDGVLLAVGNSSVPVVFTSVRDDTAGGDSNAWEGSVIAAPGDWGDLYFRGGSPASRLEHVIVRYGGALDNAEVNVVSGTMTIANSEIGYSSTGGVLTGSSPGPVLDGNWIHDLAGWGVSGAGSLNVKGTLFDRMAGGVSLANVSGSPLFNSNTFQNITGQGIYFGGSEATPIFSGNTFQSITGQTIVVAGESIYPQEGGGNVYGSNIGENGIFVQGYPTNDSWGTGSLTMLGIPYVLRAGYKVVLPGATLTIAPGVVVKFSKYQTVDSRIYVYGALAAVGTSSAPIVFTSVRDDTAGGDSNVWEGSVNPAPGDWGSLYFRGDSSASRLEHVIVRYGGALDNAEVNVVSGTMTIANSEIGYSSTGGVLTGSSPGPVLDGNWIHDLAGWGVSGAGSLNATGNLFDHTAGGVSLGNISGSPAFSSNTFQNITGQGIYFGGPLEATPILSGNTFHDITGQTIVLAGQSIFPQEGGGNVYGSNIGENGIYVQGYPSNDSWGTGSLTMLGIPYVLRAGYKVVLPGATLTIAPGIVLKFSKYQTADSRIYVYGALVAVGTSSAPIVFTSLRDATVDGVSNAWENDTTPAPGDWGNLYFRGDSLASRLKHVIVRYGGSQEGAGVYIQGGGAPQIISSNIGSSSANGIVLSGASPLITGTTIQLNALAGISANSQSHPEIHGNIISGNGAFGVENNDPSVTVSAQYNYWGAASGPKHSSNPDGAGDRVSDNVDFVPFLNATPDLTKPADLWPPRTQLAAGTPRSGTNPVIVSSETLLSLLPVDDRAVPGDGQGAGIAQTQYAVDGGTFAVYAGTFTLVQPGTHTVSFFSTDLVGHVEQATGTVVLVMDSSPPATSLTFSIPPYLDGSSRSWISTGTTFALDGGGQTGTVTTYRIDAGPLLTYASPFLLTEGNHVLTYQSQNIFGISGSTQQATLYADGSSPAMQILFSADAYIDNSGNVFIDTGTRVALLPRDILSGVARVQYRIDGSSSAPFQIYQSTFTLGAGVHTLEVQALDNVGNLRSAPGFSVNVGTTPPNGAESGPTVTTLPDGTPIVGSPTPVTIPPPGGAGAGGVTLPAVQSITLSPASPVGVGLLSITVKFSKPMNNTADPVVTVTLPGQGPVSVNERNYVGDTWTGAVPITDKVNSGAAALLVSGAQDGSGNLIVPTPEVFQIAITLLPPPANVAAAPANGQLVLSWPVVSGAASYNLYRTTWSLTSRIGIAPLRAGAGSGFADSPSPDAAAFYYGVTSVAADGTEGRLSPPAAVSMPLAPAITQPAAAAFVDFSSTVIQGVAQPGALIDLSDSISTGTLATVTAGPGGTFQASVVLGHGPFTVSARARSAVTGQVSAAYSVSFTVVDLPAAPGNLTAIPGDTKVTLSWTLSPPAGLAGCNIYRDGNPTPLNAQLLPANQSAYQDIALTDGRTYSYVVTSVNTSGVEGLSSASAQATPAAGPGW